MKTLSESVKTTKFVGLDKLMEHGYLLNKDVNDEFYYKFSKKGEFGQIEFVTEKVTLIGIERTESEIFKYIAKCTFKGKTFYCSDWKLEKEVIEETKLRYGK
jgi:hypothetical protein